MTLLQTTDVIHFGVPTVILLSLIFLFGVLAMFVMQLVMDKNRLQAKVKKFEARGRKDEKRNRFPIHPITHMEQQILQSTPKSNLAARPKKPGIVAVEEVVEDSNEDDPHSDRSSCLFPP